MSDRRYTAIFGAAVLTAGAATFAVYRMFGAAAEPRREPTRAVVVLVQDVPAGVTVPREALGQVQWPARVAPPEALASIDSVAGRVARVALTQGEPVRATALAPRGAPPGLEGTIDPARRAIAVRVSEAAGVSGLVRPNSRVDVLVTGRNDANGGSPTARLVMADVRVLGVGSARPVESKPGTAPAADAPPPSIASIVTLEVTPVQAAQLAAAEGQGAIQVVLRGFASVGGGADLPSTGAPAAVENGERGIGVVPGMWSAAPTSGRAGRPVRPGAPARTVALTQLTARPVAMAVKTPSALVAPAIPDSVSVRVYRGGQMTVVRVEAEPTHQSPPLTLRTAAVGP